MHTPFVSTAIYASETWKSTARIRQQLGVFHQHSLRKILGITWKDHVTNMEVLSQSGRHWRTQDFSMEGGGRGVVGAEGVGVGRGVPVPTVGGFCGGGCSGCFPSPENF